MIKKRVIVYLSTGEKKEHEILIKDEGAYREKVSDVVNLLLKNSGVLQLTTPFCFYKIRNVAAVEFIDPPQPSEKHPIGFRTFQED